MKHFSIVVTLLMLICADGAAQSFTSLRSAEPVTLRTPLQPKDSIDFNGQHFSLENLLKTRLELDTHPANLDRLLSADSAGCFTLEKPADNITIYRLRTRLRADRFMKGELKITANCRAELLIDGKSQAVKNSVEDSLSKAKPLTAKLKLEPQKDYEIAVKIMSAADDPAQPLFKCEVVPDKEFRNALCIADPDMKKRFALRHTEYGPRISNVSLSPAGKYLLITRTDKYESGSASNSEVIELKSGKTILHRIPSAAWMPESEKLWYTVKSAGGRDLVTLDPASGAETVIKKSLPDGRFTWSPDESFLIFHTVDAGKTDKGPLNRLITPDDRIPNSRNRTHLSLYDLQSGTLERLTFGHQSVSLQEISHDGKRLLCISSRTEITKRPFRSSTLFEIDLPTRQTDTLVADDPFINRALYAPDNNRILVLGSPEAFNGAGKNCGEHPIANDYDVQAFILDRNDRSATPLTRDFDPSIGRAFWNRTDRRIYFETTDKDCQHIYRCDPDKMTFELLPLEADVISQFSVAAKAPEIAVYTGGGNTRRGAAYLYDAKKQRSTLIADPMAETFDDIEFGEMQPWNFTASDGTLIEGSVCLPPQFDPQRKYPLIVYYYGGTTPTTRSISSPYAPQLFASRDYVVYVIQPSGAIGYGQEFSARHVNAWGQRTADDIIEGTLKFCEEHPFVDDARIGCLGASYGGFMTMYLQTRTDIFAAAASHAGISNVTSYWGEGYWGYSYNSVAAADSYPWSNPDLFTKQGALFNADKINTPLLLLHGSADTNVPIGESIQLFNALKLLGRTVEFVTVEGENHFISDYPKRELWQNTIMAWFARWLQERPEWWNELYPERHW